VPPFPRLALLCLGFSAPTLGPLAAQTADRPRLSAVRVVQAPVIDGLLDDEAWRAPAQPAGEWLSYNPLHGDRIPQETHVWIAYDSHYLYFAFQCDDAEPERIKTSVTRRDNIFSDDWVGLSLDTLGTGQQSYHMMVNPSGIQLDMLNSVSGDEDLAPDWIWDSAGRLNGRGYAVEIRLPLQSIRFKGGNDVRMGVLFWRRVSRIGVSVAWPALEPGKWVFQKHAALDIERLEPQLTREVIPSATYSSRQSRESPGRWASADHTGEVGLSARVGLRPTITLDGTVNPDFSQVESDAFQVEVNQRYPVFFSEKRPFFMEGADIFKLAGLGNGDNSMYSAVHTRRIVDPIVGLKLTGSTGRVSFGTLSASDQAAGRELPDEDPRHDDQRVFNVGRIQYNLGPGSYAGAIVTDTRFGSERNTVAGADLSWKIRGAQTLTVTALQSWSDRLDGPSDGLATQINYLVNSRRVNVYSQFEHYDRGFAMDTAFYNRVGFTSGWGYVDYNFYPDKARHPWLRRVTPFSFLQAGRDREAGGTELISVSGFRFNFTRQGFFRVDQLVGHEPWAGQEFPLGRTRMFGQAQLFRWLQLYGNWNFGLATFYDPEEPFRGRSRNLTLGGTLQPTGRFSQAFEYQRVVFDRYDTGARVYTIDIVNARTTYHFTPRLFVRAITQYDSSRHRVLLDLLSSYELKPGTVIYAGYGSLFEKRSFADGQWVEAAGRYRTTERGLFFKASYLHRF
jgi:Domain of unknown function (DUF5916)